MIFYTDLPESEYTAKDIEIYADGTQRIYPCTTRVSAVPYAKLWPGSQRQDDQTEHGYFFSITADGATDISVKLNTTPTTAVIRPLSKNIQPRIDNGVIHFTLPGEGQYVLEADDFHNAIHIFVNKPHTSPTGATHVFGKGVHHIGVMRLESNDTVYIQDGAVIYGGFTAIGKENINICGNGIIDGSYEIRQTDTRTNPNMHYAKNYRDMDVTQDMSVLENTLYDEKMLSGCLRFYNCKNINVSGPVLRDTCTYGMIAAACTNVTIDNIKLIGMWKYNSDGIDIFNSKNITIKNCFVRTFDDSIVLKGIKGWDSRNMENILVDNCVVWCDWGRNLEFGAETNADIYRNITFTNCDCIHGTHAMMDIQNTGRAFITDVLFDNIRCEYNKNQLKASYQHDLNEKYQFGETTNIQQPQLMFISNSYDGDRFGGDTEKGRVHGITFSNIYVLADPEVQMPQSAFIGADEQHRVDRIVIKNVYFNGKKIADAKDANITINQFSEISFE